MSAALRFQALPQGEGRPVTLLELVTAVCESTSDDAEVVDTVIHLLESGRVRICGNFRDTPIDRLR